MNEVESTGGLRYTAADTTRASHVRFACVCLRASISYAIEATFWRMKASKSIPATRSASSKRAGNRPVAGASGPWPLMKKYQIANI